MHAIGLVVNRDNRSAPSQQFSAPRFRPRHHAAFGINCVVAAQRNGGIGSIRREADGDEIDSGKASERGLSIRKGLRNGLVRQPRPVDLIMLMHIGLSRLIIASGIADAQRTSISPTPAPASDYLC